MANCYGLVVLFINSFCTYLSQNRTVSGCSVFFFFLIFLVWTLLQTAQPYFTVPGVPLPNTLCGIVAFLFITSCHKSSSSPLGRPQPFIHLSHSDVLNEQALFEAVCPTFIFLICRSEGTLWAYGTSCRKKEIAFCLFLSE